MRLVGSIFLLVMQVSATLVIGCRLLLAPRRASNLLRDAFVIFPYIGPHAHRKQLGLRLLGGLLIACAMHGALGICHMFIFFLNSSRG